VTLSAGAHLQLAGATILSGATVSVRAGAPYVAATVSSGGVLSGPGAAVNVNDYGLLAGVLVTNNGFTVVEGGGVAQRDVMSDGGSEIVRGETVDDIVRAGGLEQVNKGGLASATTISRGGVMRLLGGGASGTRLLGGIETIFGGVAVGTVISGGYEFDYAVASGTQVRSGGYEKVAKGAIASGSVISSGGHEGVAAGGVAAGAAISGGTLTVSSGGAISGGLAIHAGKAIVSGTMAAGQTVTFTGTAGVLELDNLAGFQAAISGLTTPNRKVDLAGFVFSSGETVSWTQAGTSGTLTVQDGAETASLTLIGTYATSSFHLAGDGRGGTIVTDPHTTPDALPAATRLAQAAAALEGGRAAASFATVHGGGAPLGASPLVIEATSGR